MNYSDLVKLPDEGQNYQLLPVLVSYHEMVARMKVAEQPPLLDCHSACASLLTAPHTKKQSQLY